VLYRLFIPQDFAALYAIEEACFQPPLRFGRRYMRQLIDGPGSATWIAEEGGQMAGFAIVGWRMQGKEAVAYIQTLEVAPEQRGRGVGGELLRRLEGSAHDAGARVIRLHVDETNADAIRLYQAHGYVCQGRSEDYYTKGRAGLLFVKQLGPMQ
jgi:ribosomal-protein-alanine N-acetyltransferase